MLCRPIGGEALEKTIAEFGDPDAWRNRYFAGDESALNPGLDAKPNGGGNRRLSRKVAS